jgi:hypothetical protein
MQWRRVIATKQVDVRSKALAQAQLMNSSPALRLRCGANGGASRAGLMVLEKLKGKGETPTQIRGKSNPPELTRTNEEERCRS